MIYQLSIDFPMFPKPRGNIGNSKAKGAFIYHSTSEYTRFKKAIDIAAKKCALPGKFSWASTVGISVIESFTTRQSSSDMDNCLGGLLDALVQKNYLIDDSKKYIQEQHYWAIESDRSYSIVLIYPITDSWQAYQTAQKHFQLIQEYNLKNQYVSKY